MWATLFLLENKYWTMENKCFCRVCFDMKPYRETVRQVAVYFMYIDIVQSPGAAQCVSCSPELEFNVRLLLLPCVTITVAGLHQKMHHYHLLLFQFLLLSRWKFPITKCHKKKSAALATSETDCMSSLINIGNYPHDEQHLCDHGGGKWRAEPLKALYYRAEQKMNNWFEFLCTPTDWPHVSHNEEFSDYEWISVPFSCFCMLRGVCGGRSPSPLELCQHDWKETPRPLCRHPGGTVSLLTCEAQVE